MSVLVCELELCLRGNFRLSFRVFACLTQIKIVLKPATYTPAKCVMYATYAVGFSTQNYKDVR